MSESGYYLRPNGQLDVNHPKIQADIEHGNSHTIYGYLRQTLNYRRKQINQPITIACCDNIINNGLVLKNAFNTFLSTCADEDLLRWIDDNVSFPCSMVDRITPKIDDLLSHEINSLFNLHDDSSILAESYIQWVIEDNFKGIKPPLNCVGIEFVENIKNHENLKIRVLNGGHSCLAYLSALRGYTFFDKAFNNEKIRAFFNTIQQHEILPTITGFSSVQLEQYLNTITGRFSNRYIADTVETHLHGWFCENTILHFTDCRTSFAKR